MKKTLAKTITLLLLLVLLLAVFSGCKSDAGPLKMPRIVFIP